jgi:hypothetical protein
MALSVVIPKHCGGARMQLDRRGDMGGGGEAGGIGTLTCCSNVELSGTGFSLVSDIGVCSLTGEKIG